MKTSVRRLNDLKSFVFKTTKLFLECEWPLFYCYLILNHAFQNNKDAVSVYAEKLEEIMVKTEEGMKLVPELYTVPHESVSNEYKNPGCSTRQAVGRVSLCELKH